MPEFMPWNVVSDYYSSSWKRKEWKHPNAVILTFNKLPPYIKSVTALALSDDLPAGEIIGFGFELATNAPEKTVYDSFSYAMENANKVLSDKYHCAIAHAYIAGQFGPREEYPGYTYLICGIIAVEPLIMATGIRLGQAGAVLSEIARFMTDQLRSRGYLASVDFSNPKWNYHLSVISTIAGVITSGELWKPTPAPQPETPTEEKKWYEREDVKWILIGIGAILLLAILLRK